MLTTPNDVRRASMDLLARREHSRRELARKLAARVDDKAMLEQVLDQLVEDNLLSDERFCEAFVRSRINKQYGPVRIRAELRERGVDDSLVAQYLQVEKDIWFDQLAELVLKKYGPAPATDARSRASQQRFLAQRGYSFEQINQVLSRGG